MCGIVGGVDLERIRKLIPFNVKRGNCGFGGLSLAQDREIIFRYNKPYTEDLFIPHGDFILCHSLASTGDAKRIHPFETDRFILAHNGILLDYKAFENWAIGPVDSQYLLGGIQFNVDAKVNPIKAIVITNESLKGQRACWMWDRFEKVAYFWRVMSPVFYSLNPFIFSSVEFENSKMMQEGIIYCWQDNLFSKCESFKFYSPYLV